jgi:hypothetical protein
MIYNNDDKESRDIAKNIYNDKYNLNLQDLPEFHEFDLKDSSNKFVVEVKNLNIKLLNFPRLMFGYNKYIKAKGYIKRNYRVFILFICLDGIFSHEYKGEYYKPEKAGRKDRGKDEIKDYIFIKRDKFEKIDFTQQLDF